MKILAIKTAVIIIGLFTLFLSTGPVMAMEDEKPTASADMSILSKYVWRGFELSKDSIVLQPSITVGYKGVGLNLWGNLDTDLDENLGGDDTGSQFNETDLTLSYDTSVGPVAVGIGYIYYGLDGLTDSEELYISLGLDTLLAPSLTIYREIAHLPAWYLSLDIGHSFELSKGITLDLAGSFSYYISDDDAFAEVNDPTEKYNGLHNGLISIGLTIPMGEFSIAPTIAYSFPLSDEAEDMLTGIDNDSDFVYGGVTFSLAF